MLCGFFCDCVRGIDRIDVSEVLRAKLSFPVDYSCLKSVPLRNLGDPQRHFVQRTTDERL